MSTVSNEKQKPQSKRRLDEANAAGEYRLVEPLDYLILQQLQDEGTLMGGYYPLATTVPALVKHFKKELPTSIFSSRLRVMNLQGLVVSIPTAGSKSGWQRTKKGKELLEAWQKKG